ncbi:ferritin-like domain-containing protein [Streptomyces chitinivorans]|uniref:Ferritin-like domain-containing protein n=1 Tax=Streptomyces chitinivorans TaxID=1257027 RepID=A0ABW7HN90_9ACTN|nr:ferritin-like domain-containing protein [Streptomyces chitinivorans]MDH2411091.1 ferritin-like domain-containing protein [Streptomyces chitinivorans]
MLRRRDLVREVLDDDASFRLLCSLAVAAQARNGRENRRIAALVPRGRRDLAPAMARYGELQERHARLLTGLLAACGPEPAEVPPEADHAALLERRGSCPAHVRMRCGQPLSERDVLAHLAHGHAAAARATAWLARLAGHAFVRPGAGEAVREVFRAEREYLAWCREGMLGFARAGHVAAVELVLRENTLAEARAHRDAALAVLARTGHLLGWSMARSVVLEGGVQARYVHERLVARRRAVRLDPLPALPEPEPEPEPGPEPGPRRETARPDPGAGSDAEPGSGAAPGTGTRAPSGDAATTSPGA